MNLIQQNIKAVNELCIKHKVKKLYAYGSVLDEKNFREESDVDLIVKFDERVPVEKYADLYFNLIEEFEKIFNRRVELMTDKPIANRFLRVSIEASKKIIYAAA